MEKICIFCVHLKYNEAGFGEYAEPAELICNKNHVLVNKNRGWQFVYTLEDFRRMIKTAETCTDYEQVKP